MLGQPEIDQEKLAPATIVEKVARLHIPMDNIELVDMAQGHQQIAHVQPDLGHIHPRVEVVESVVRHVGHHEGGGGIASQATVDAHHVLRSPGKRNRAGKPYIRCDSLGLESKNGNDMDYIFEYLRDFDLGFESEHFLTAPLALT